MKDEVIVPAYTYASASPVAQRLLCDYRRRLETFEMDYDKAAEAIIKAVIPVDSFGGVRLRQNIWNRWVEERLIFKPANKLQAAIRWVAVILTEHMPLGPEEWC